MPRFGTYYGGWFIPDEFEISEDSIIYGVGVGEDISFELNIQNTFKSNIILIDPTQRSITHFKEIQNYYKTNEWDFSGDIQHDYEEQIGSLNPYLSKFKYIEKALWEHNNSLKFYKQDDDQYVSQTLIENMFGSKYDIVESITIENIMKQNNHKHIDILKLDIEGAEITVLNHMLDCKIYPKVLCIEFDLILKGKDVNNHTKQIINRLQNDGYKVVHNDNMNITFTYTDST